MRILMVSDVYFPRINGVSTAIQTYREALSAHGIEVSLVAPDYGNGCREPWISRVAARPVQAITWRSASSSCSMSISSQFNPRSRRMWEARATSGHPGRAYMTILGCLIGKCERNKFYATCSTNCRKNAFNW